MRCAISVLLFLSLPIGPWALNQSEVHAGNQSDYDSNQRWVAQDSESDFYWNYPEPSKSETPGKTGDCLFYLTTALLAYISAVLMSLGIFLFLNAYVLSKPREPPCLSRCPVHCTSHCSARCCSCCCNNNSVRNCLHF